MPQRLRRTIAVALAATALLTTALLTTVATSAGAGASAPGPDRGPRIVGGTEAPPGAWPSQAALLTHGVDDPFQAQYCGATVLSRSWVLTAGHCLDEGTGATPASGVDVLAGTNELATGQGQRRDAKEIRFASGFDPLTLRNDLALIRLDTPVSAPAMPLIAQGAAFAPGTDLVTTGWGSTGSGYPTKLRQVTVPAISDADCDAAYPSQIDSTSMFCAGFLATGGKDSCQGDSGGPISRLEGSVWVQVGIVGWGNGCAQPGFPGVYTRLAKFTNWVRSQIRFGPEPDATSFVRQTYLDLFGRLPSRSESSADVDTLASMAVADYVNGRLANSSFTSFVGGVARLYRAYFGRNADTSGMNFWVPRVRTARSLSHTSSAFAASSEFTRTYGSLSDSGFVDLVYHNVLDRDPDSSGQAFWVGQLRSGARNRGQVMTSFSESNEFVTKTRTITAVTTTFWALVRRVPNSGEYAKWTPKPTLDLVRSLLSSYSYAARF